MSGQKKDFQNLEPEMKHPDGNGSGTETQEVSGPVTRSCKAGGPRTAEGKERSKHNALKHGIFSETLLLKGESKAEFRAITRGLRQDFQPVGTFEEGLVETLAVTRWRQRRLLIAEAAEIEAGIQFAMWDDAERQREEANNLPADFGDSGLIGKIANTEVLDACLRWLDGLKVWLQAYGFDPKNSPPYLPLIYGKNSPGYWRSDILKTYQYIVWAFGKTDESRAEVRGESYKECVNNFMAAVDREIDRLSRYKSDREIVQDYRMEVEMRRRNVPGAPRLDQLIRYSAALERTFERTLSQLERAQRTRLGQPVPPRIDVNVSSS